LSLSLIVSYFVLLICYSAIRLLSRKYAIKLGVSVSDQAIYQTVAVCSSLPVYLYSVYFLCTCAGDST